MAFWRKRDFHIVVTKCINLWRELEKRVEMNLKNWLIGEKRGEILNDLKPQWHSLSDFWFSTSHSFSWHLNQQTMVFASLQVMVVNQLRCGLQAEIWICFPIMCDLSLWDHFRMQLRPLHSLCIPYSSVMTNLDSWELGQIWFKDLAGGFISPAKSELRPIIIPVDRTISICFWEIPILNPHKDSVTFWPRQ